MDFVWYILGLLNGTAAIFMWRFSKQRRLNPLAWSGLVLGTFLILFSIAWSVSSVLEGVPRAASMGLLFFGLSGVVLLTATHKYIDTKLKKIDIEDVAVQPAVKIISPEKVTKKVSQAERARTL